MIFIHLAQQRIRPYSTRPNGCYRPRRRIRVLVSLGVIMRRQFVVSSVCVLSRTLAVTVGAIVASGLIHPVAAVAHTAPPPASPAQTRSESDAVAEAHRTGRPVEVADRTTETTQILANPNGSFTM